jgi:hypothetical protein
MESVDMDLTFQGVVIGTVHNAFLSDGVWYGTCEPHHDDVSSSRAKRVADYVSFCERWKEKTTDAESGGDASLFSSFSDVVFCEGWKARSIEGDLVVEIEDAPVFLIGGEVTFRASREV